MLRSSRDLFSTDSHYSVSSLFPFFYFSYFNGFSNYNA